MDHFSQNEPKSVGKVRPLALWIAFTGLALAAALVLFWVDPGRGSLYPVCVFHAVTGLLCPGCGSLRAIHQLLHGHFLAALHFNALLVLFLPALGIALARAALARNQRPAGVSPAALVLLIVLILVFGVARNLPFAHAAWLAP